MAVESSDPRAALAVENGAPPTNGKTQYHLVGASVGLGLGLLTAYLFVHAAEESMSARAAEERLKGPTPKPVPTWDLLKLTLSIVNLMRQIAKVSAKS
jgi:hypothetical protein